MEYQVEKAEGLTPEQRDERVKDQLTKYGLEPVSQVQVRDPFTGQLQTITIDRTGTNESKLIVALANPDLTRDQKDSILSMYLFERGKESASFIADLMIYKGQYTKESRVFKSRMRFDFEAFANSFVNYLNSQADRTGKWFGVDIRAEKQKFTEWLEKQKAKNKDKTYTFADYYKGKDKAQGAMIEQAIFAIDEANHLILQIRQIAAAREADKGGGIYVDRGGRPYSVNDPDLDDIIKKDRELQKQAEQE